MTIMAYERFNVKYLGDTEINHCSLPEATGVLFKIIIGCEEVKSLEQMVYSCN
jgi:hypothetical protein